MITRPTSITVLTINIESDEKYMARLLVSSLVSAENRKSPAWYRYTAGSSSRPSNCVRAPVCHPCSETRCARSMSNPPASDSDSATNSTFESCAYSTGCAIVQPMRALVAPSGWRSARRQIEPSDWASRPMPSATVAIMSTSSGDVAANHFRQPCSPIFLVCSKNCGAVWRESSKKVERSISRTKNSRRGPHKRISNLTLMCSSSDNMRRWVNLSGFFVLGITRASSSSVELSGKPRRAISMLLFSV
mmetsp:Transcript_41807/g.81958  ORF Transcript_41807/g.81958 Transcript_41807/m.81958 type:complete len:247 (+) Transcript_41807:582-1322(+)